MLQGIQPCSTKVAIFGPPCKKYTHSPGDIRGRLAPPKKKKPQTELKGLGRASALPSFFAGSAQAGHRLRLLTFVRVF